MQFLLDLASNILANIIFWLLLGLIAWASIQFSQRTFLRFFDLSTRKQLVIFLSNLQEIEEGKADAYVISEHEFRAVESVNRLFGSVPFRLPEIVRGLVDSFWIGNALDIRTKVSPPNLDKVSITSNMIIVGGNERNATRRYYTQKATPYLLLSNELEVFQQVSEKGESYVKIMKGTRQNEIITGNYNFAVIEKMYDDEHKVTVFMCVGYRADSSWAASEYLTRHWQDMKRKYGNKEFALCLGFPAQQSYMTSYEEPLLLLKLPFH